ncbi:hypothetical protein WJX73_004052 [Symbiochloris irregularis]|uniref:Uncharacterized protein n=1 Tax=Symbiochloris irregularis TaxID=706552 RepID=A0AAW1NPB7_9CHLO
MLRAFGDSLSDNGDEHGVQAIVRRATENFTASYPGPPYYQGAVYSNGPVWLTVASDLLDVPLDDWAVAGATSGAFPAPPLPFQPPRFGLKQPVNATLPSSLEQAGNFTAGAANLSLDTSLHVVFIGGNDYLALGNGVNVTPEAVVSYIEQALDVLYSAGARSFLVPNLPPFNRIPAVLQGAYALPDAQGIVERAVRVHNQLLRVMTADFVRRHRGAVIIPFDFYTFFEDLLANATAAGIDTRTPCTQAYPQGPSGACLYPRNYVFFDVIHPSYWVHEEAGVQLASLLEPMVSVATD